MKWIKLNLITFHPPYVLTYLVIEAANNLLCHSCSQTFAERLLGNFSIAVPVFVALSCYGSMNGCLFALSRYTVFFLGCMSHIYDTHRIHLTWKCSKHFNFNYEGLTKVVFRWWPEVTKVGEYWWWNKSVMSLEPLAFNSKLTYYAFVCPFLIF